MRCSRRSGFFPVGDLLTYSQDGSPLTGHVSHHVPGVELSTGSLGHGLCPSVAVWRWAAKRDVLAFRTYVIVSDGELDEGLELGSDPFFAGHHKLDSLTALVDYNKIQSFRQRQRSARSGAARRQVAQLQLDRMRDRGPRSRRHQGLAGTRRMMGKPKVILAHTIKGKGVAYMEGLLAWHYKSPDAKQLAEALGWIGVRPMRNLVHRNV